jgi:predicted Zn-dependent protease
MRTEEIAEYRRLVALAPREPRFVIELADLLIGQGQRDEAFRMLAEASARAGSDPNVHERLAEVYARHGRQQDALHEIELVARYDPTSPVGLVALGRQYMELGQRDRALATWHRILDTARDRARGAVSLAEVYADNAMLNEAVEMYRLAISLRPDDVEFHRGPIRRRVACDRTRSAVA